MNVYSSRSHTIFRMVCLDFIVLSYKQYQNIYLMPQVTQVIESREKADETEAGDSCDAVRVSVLVHAIPSLH